MECGALSATRAALPQADVRGEGERRVSASPAKHRAAFFRLGAIKLTRAGGGRSETVGG